MATQPLRPASSASDDVALIERAIAGEEAALTGLYRRHASYVAGLVYRVLGSDADLDDIVQETMEEGLRRLADLREPASLKPFLVTIAIRRIHARLSLRYRMKSLASQLFGATPAVTDPGARLEVHALYQLLARVAAKHRIVWVLHRIEGYTLPEVAEQTGASLATVKRWIAEVDRRVEEHHAPA